MPTANDILARKGFSVFVVPAAASVRDAVDRMNQLRVGAVGVSDGRDGRLSGMFTERDVLRRVVGERRDPSATHVADVMTTDVICCGPDTEMDEISAIMQQKRVRHLPVCDCEGDLLGMISIGDVNAQHATHQEATITYLNEYLYGRV
jgi:CBS domain-containing protein